MMSVLLVCFLSFFETANAEPLWQTLPPTPVLPKADQSGYAVINGTRIWYAEFGHGKPVILLHGAFTNSNYWGNQIPVLAKNYKVIVMDSRGQGRSENNEKFLSYDLMSSDVIGLMDFLKIKQAAIIGWSDGAIIGLDIAIHHPERLTKLFAYGANSDPNGIRPDVMKSSVIQTCLARTKIEYKKLSPTPSQYQALSDQLNKMMDTQPNFTKAQLNSITVPIWIVDGDHDEGIKRENTEFMAAEIPGAGLLILPSVSHFAFLQNPEQFNDDVMNFLAAKPVY